MFRGRDRGDGKETKWWPLRLARAEAINNLSKNIFLEKIGVYSANYLKFSSVKFLCIFFLWPAGEDV